jgi:hypothetical protein
LSLPSAIFMADVDRESQQNLLKPQIARDIYVAIRREQSDGVG